jgi:hypothetical protein
MRRAIASASAPARQAPCGYERSPPPRLLREARMIGADLHEHEPSGASLVGVHPVGTQLIDHEETGITQQTLPRHSPVRQHLRPGGKGILRDHTSRYRAAVLPRGRQGHQHAGRRAAGRSEDGRGHDPLRAHDGSSFRSGADVTSIIRQSRLHTIFLLGRTW